MECLAHETRLNAHGHATPIDVLKTLRISFQRTEGELEEVLTSKYSLHSTSMGCHTYVVYIECYFRHYESEYNRYFNIRQLASVLNPITE